MQPAMLHPLWMQLAVILDHTDFHVSVSELRAELITSAPFTAPTHHSPHAFGQQKVLPPHHDNLMVAEEENCISHMVAATRAASQTYDPWHEEEDYLCDAVQFLASLMLSAPLAVKAERIRRLNKLKAIAKRLRHLTVQAVAIMPPTVALIAAGYHIALLAAITRAMEWPDEYLAHCFVSGFAVCGDIYPSRIHRSTIITASIDHTQSHVAWIIKLIRSIRKRARKAKGDSLTDLQVVYDATVNEVTAGWAQGPFDKRDLDERFPSGWWPIRRFAQYRYPGAKCRPCDNAAESEHNDAFSASEKIACENADFPARVCAMFFCLHIMCAMLIGTDDLTKAYRQIPSMQPQYTIVAVWCIAKSRVEFFIILGLPFGLHTSVLQFNRLPKLIEAFMRAYFFIAICHYYDDFCIVEPEISAHLAQFILRRTIDILGFLLDAEKHKRAAPANPFLGIVSNLASYGQGFIKMQITPERKQKVTDALSHCKQEKCMSSGTASTIRGKLYFSCTSAWGRVGRAPLQSFVARQYQKTTSFLTRDLVSAIDFFILLLACMPPRTVDLTPHRRSKLLIWTDAMFQLTVGRLGWVVLDMETGKLFYSYFTVPAWIYELWDQRAQYIGQLEILAAVCVYLSLPEYMIVGREILHWIDNTSAMASLFKGYTGVTDSSRMVNIFHLFAAKMRFTTWWEFVASKANVADLPSRLVFDLLIKLDAIYMQTTIPTYEQFTAPLADLLHAFMPLAPSGRKPRDSRAVRRRNKARVALEGDCR
jgi:hypothetical protein